MEALTQMPSLSTSMTLLSLPHIYITNLKCLQNAISCPSSLLVSSHIAKQTDASFPKLYHIQQSLFVLPPDEDRVIHTTLLYRYKVSSLHTLIVLKYQLHLAGLVTVACISKD